MDYTKNYHLPQWVKSDRIMMDDFNRMCADIENGLTGNWQKSGELSSRIEQVAGEAREQILTSDTASQTSLKNGLLRLAYNHCYMLAAFEKQPPQSGFFFQRLGGAGPQPSVSGLLNREDALWIARGGTAYSMKDFTSQLKQISEMKIVRGNAAENRPLVLRFTPPGPGYFTKFTIHSDLRDSICSETVWHVAFFNENTGIYEQETDLTLKFAGAYRNGYNVFTNLFCFNGGVPYRIEISTADDGYNGKAEYRFVESYFSTVSLTDDTNCAVSCTVPCGEEKSDGLVLVQYRMGGTGGTLSLNWDGALLSPVHTRSLVNFTGKPVMEAAFRKNGRISANTALRLNARCNVGGDIALYGWAMATI